MSGRLTGSLVLCLLTAIMPGSVLGANVVTWSYDLADHGGSLYTYTFNFWNTGPAKDAVFKIHIDGQAVPVEWLTVSWNTPTGWTGARGDQYLDWSTGNGDISNDGYYRLYGQPGAPNPPTMGWTSQTFGWTFNSNGGPTPTGSYFNANDVVIHIQPLDDTWHNAGTSYPTNPSPIPEPSGLIALLTGLAGAAGSASRRRR